MSRENTDTFAFQSVPHITCPVVVTAEQHAARGRERNRCNTAEDIVMRERIQFAICSQIEQATRSIIRSCCECVAIGEESAKAAKNRGGEPFRIISIIISREPPNLLHSIDIRFMPDERLRSLAHANVP